MLRDLRRVEASLYGHAKFGTLRRYRLADRLFVMAPAGLVRRRELPAAWGLIECPRLRLRRSVPLPGELDDLPLRLTVDAVPLGAPERRRQRLLRNVAAALSRRAVVRVSTSEPADRPR